MIKFEYQRECQKAVRSKFDISQFKNPTAVTLTLKQSYSPDQIHHFRLSRIDAENNLRYFLNFLNRAALGTSRARRERIPCYAVLEGCAYQYKRFHYHLCLDRPDRVQQEDFDFLINKCWNKTHFGYREIDIVHQCDSGFTNYITKFATKENFLDAIDWINFHSVSERAV